MVLMEIRPIVERLVPPEGEGVIELEEVDPLRRVVVGTSVHLLVTVPPKNNMFFSMPLFKSLQNFSFFVYIFT